MSDSKGYREGDVIRYVGQDIPGPVHGSLGFVEEVAGDRIAIQTVTPEGRGQTAGACSVKDICLAKDDGRIALFQNERRRFLDEHRRWQKKVNKLYRLIETRHGLKEGQAQVIHSEVSEVLDYLEPPPEGPWLQDGPKERT